jgi:hypothetical protein
MREYPIYQMSSFSRSGETLMLRCLNAHRDIEVVHQIREPESKEDTQLWANLLGNPTQAIAADDPLIAHRKPSASAIFVLKNAVWNHHAPRKGFILVRNPFSVAVSSNRHLPAAADDPLQRQKHVRWCRTIDPHMLPFVQKAPNLISWLALYSRKMMHDYRSGLPIVRYEEFVQNPERMLRKIVAHLGLEWDPHVLESHLDYKEGDLGHGGIKLWSPIHTGSTEKYKKLPRERLSTIYSLTCEVLTAYGYQWTGDDILLQDVPQLL